MGSWNRAYCCEQHMTLFQVHSKASSCVMHTYNDESLAQKDIPRSQCFRKESDQQWGGHVCQGVLSKACHRLRLPLKIMKRVPVLKIQEKCLFLPCLKQALTKRKCIDCHLESCTSCIQHQFDELSHQKRRRRRAARTLRQTTRSVQSEQATAEPRLFCSLAFLRIPRRTRMLNHRHGCKILVLMIALAWIPHQPGSDAFVMVIGSEQKYAALSNSRQPRAASCPAFVPTSGALWQQSSNLHARTSNSRASESCTSVRMSSIPTFECIKNVRDLASVSNSPVKAGRYVLYHCVFPRIWPGSIIPWSIHTRFVTTRTGGTHSHLLWFSRVFRAACVGTASPSDECLLVENIKTLVDLRSEQELSGDIMKYNSTVFDSYGSLTYDVQMSKKSGRPKAMLLRKDDDEAQRYLPYFSLHYDSASVNHIFCCRSPRTRHLLSVIDENVRPALSCGSCRVARTASTEFTLPRGLQIYKRGVWKKLRLKKKVKAALYMAFSYAKARKIFLGMILMNSFFF
jgi:hypothetical protein